MERKGSFDYILLETTGLADPGNIAPIFWVDDGLGSSIYLDGIVTVVDAKNLLKSLDEPAIEELPENAIRDTGISDKETNVSASIKDAPSHEHSGPLMTTAHLQISHADVIILNKSDLVSPSELATVKARISSINALARITTTTRSRVPSSQLSGTLLDLNAYTTFITTPDWDAKGHSHLDSTISTISLLIPPIDEHKIYLLQNWIQEILWSEGQGNKGYEVHRMKGKIAMTDGSMRVVQGVREIFEIVDIPREQDRGGGGEVVETEGKIVLIGRGLDKIPVVMGMST